MTFSGTLLNTVGQRLQMLVLSLCSLCLSDHLGKSSALFLSFSWKESLCVTSLRPLLSSLCLSYAPHAANCFKADSPERCSLVLSDLPFPLSSPLLCSNNTSFLFPSPCLTPPGPGRPTPLNRFFSQLLPKSIWWSPKGSQSLASEGVISNKSGVHVVQCTADCKRWNRVRCFCSFCPLLKSPADNYEQ